MGVKIKNRDPKPTDFSPNDIVVNVKDGTIFYKTSNNTLFKLTGNNVNTSTTSSTASSADNLGNHTATQDLNLDSNNITNVNHITASGNISSSGVIISEQVGIGRKYSNGFPEYALDIQGTSPVLRIADYTNSNVANASAIWMGENGVGETRGAGIWYSGNNNSLNLVTTDNGTSISSPFNSTKRLTILESNGNVGIGATSPGKKLTVHGNISSSGTVTGLSGSFSHILGNSPITVQDQITFQSSITSSGINASGNVNTVGNISTLSNKLVQIGTPGEHPPAAFDTVTYMYGGMFISGSIIPMSASAYDLGHPAFPFDSLHVNSNSIKFYDGANRQIGHMRYEEGKGIKVQDAEDTLSAISASHGTFSEIVKTPSASIGLLFDSTLIRGSINGGSF